MTNEKPPDERLKTILEAIGALLIVVGIALVSIPLALIAAGGFVLLAAYPIKIPKRGKR